MTPPHWQTNTSFSAIVFDCDGTLSTIEGIDFLAKNNGVYQKVKALTDLAMQEVGLNENIYQQRLDLVLPRREQVYALGYQYFMHKTPHIVEVIQLLQRLDKTVYILSAGVNPAVKMFGEMLQVPKENIFAVDLRFDQQGNFLHYEKDSPLIQNDGKKIIVEQLKLKHPQIVHIGDGLNDVVTRDIVSRFIGYGGVMYRKNIAEICEFYINTLSFTAILPLILTQMELAMLKPHEWELYNNGLKAMDAGQVEAKKEEEKSTESLQPLLHLQQKLT